MYVFKKTEENLWTVGFYEPMESGVVYKDYDDEAQAAAAVHYLNGGK